MSQPQPEHLVPGRRLSALLVNYDSGPFALTCVRSLRRAWAEGGGEPADLEVVVVDNASPTDQGAFLASLQEEGAQILVERSNLGCAAGLQVAFEASRGGPDDFVLLLQPDVVLLPGSLGELLAHLETHPLVGAVAPRAYVDPGLCLHAPPPHLPDARSEALDLAARISPGLARLRMRRASRTALAHWRGSLPSAWDALPGACLLLPRSVVEGLDGLMDRRYPLYYEDADLCRRLAARGLGLEMLPRATVLHHVARSVGWGAQAQDAERRRRLSRAAYLERWSGRVARRGLAALEALVQHWPDGWRDRPPNRSTHLVPRSSPVELRLPVPGPWVVELATSPAFDRPFGLFAEGGTWKFPSSAWEWLFAGRWFLRAVHGTHGRVGGAWTFQKTSPARTEPVDLDSLPAPGDGESGTGSAARRAS